MSNRWRSTKIEEWNKDIWDKDREFIIRNKEENIILWVENNDNTKFIKESRELYK
jgi:hypothetical protein